MVNTTENIIKCSQMAGIFIPHSMGKSVWYSMELCFLFLFVFFFFLFFSAGVFVPHLLPRKSLCMRSWLRERLLPSLLHFSYWPVPNMLKNYLCSYTR